MVHFFALMLWVAGRAGLRRRPAPAGRGHLRGRRPQRGRSPSSRSSGPSRPPSACGDLLPRAGHGPCGTAGRRDRRRRAGRGRRRAARRRATGSPPTCVVESPRPARRRRRCSPARACPRHREVGDAAVRRHASSSRARAGQCRGHRRRHPAGGHRRPHRRRRPATRARWPVSCARVVADRRRPSPSASALGFFGVSLLFGTAGHGRLPASPSASPSPWCPRACCPPSPCRWPWAPSAWPRATRWSATSRRSRPWVRPPSSAPTRPAP